MTLPSGRISIDFASDEQFIKLVQIKDKSAGKVFFAPGQNVSPGSASIGGKNVTGFSNINLQFGDAEGSKFAAEILVMLAT